MIAYAGRVSEWPMSTPDPAPSSDVTCVITGGVSGIGLAVAKRVLARGQFSHCAIVDRDEGRYDELKEYGDRTTLVRCDVRDVEAVASAVDQIDGWGPPITGLVNCAGVAHFVPTAEVVLDDWDRVVQINVTGTLNASNAVARKMRSGQAGRSSTWPRCPLCSAGRAAPRTQPPRRRSSPSRERSLSSGRRAAFVQTRLPRATSAPRWSTS